METVKLLVQRIFLCSVLLISYSFNLSNYVESRLKLNLSSSKHGLLSIRFLLIAIALSLFFTSCRVNTSSSKNQPTATNGILDLTDWDFEKEGTINLSGEWEFYWGELLEPKDFETDSLQKKTRYVYVPSYWENLNYEGENMSAHGYATYRLTIKLKQPKETMALKVPDMHTAYKLWVDGVLVSFNGKTGKSRDEMQPEYIPKTSSIIINGESVNVILQVSNFVFYNGGMRKSPILGTNQQIQWAREGQLMFEMVLFGIILIMGLYHWGLHLLRKKDKSTLYFGLLCLIVAFRIIGTGERVLAYLFDIPWELHMKIAMLPFYLFVPIFAMFLLALYPAESSKKFVRSIQIIASLFVFVVVVFPSRIFSQTIISYEIVIIVGCLYFIKVLVSAASKKRGGSVILLVGFSLFFLTIINDILAANLIIHTLFISPLGLFIFILSQSFALSMRFSKAFTNVENQVADRTYELEQANQEITKQKDKYKESYESVTLLNNIGQDISSNLSVENIAHSVYQNISTLMTVDRFGIGIIDKTKNLIIFKDYLANSDKFSSLEFPLDNSDWLAVHCVMNNIEIISGDIKAEYSQYIPSVTKPHANLLLLNSIIVLPLVINEKVIGCIGVQSNEKSAYENFHVDLLRSLSIDVGIAVENSRIFDELEKKSAENKILYKLSSNLIESIELEDLLENVMHAAVELVPKAQVGSIFLLNSDNEILEGKVAIGLSKEEIKKVKLKIGEAQSGKAVAEKRSFIENKVQKDYIVTNKLLDNYTKPIKSIIVVLLKIGERIIGTISVESHDEFNAFTEADLNKLSSLASNASVAIERVRMHREIEKQVDIIRKSESQLLENQIRFKDAFNLSRIAMWEFDVLNNRAILNEEYCDIIGLPYKAQSSPYFDGDEYYVNYVHNDDKVAYSKIFKKAAIAKDESYQDMSSFRIVKPDGELAWILGTFRVRFNSYGKVVTLYGTVQDVTELKQTEEELKSQAIVLKNQSEELQETNNKLIELDEYKEAMTAMIVHDFKNSLNTVISFSDGEPTKRRLKSIQQSGQFMLNMVMNILDVQKFESTEVKLGLSQNTITQQINKAIQRVSYLIDQKSVNISFIPSLDIITNSDDELITRVIINILSNAIKYVPTNGNIVIAINLKGSFVEISVKDDGVGIPKDKLHLVFEKYAQIDAKKSGFARSTGIGLAFCKMVVEAHGGEIDLVSVEGRGTTFWFTIPLSSELKTAELSTNKLVEISKIGDQDVVLSESASEAIQPYLTELRKWEVYDYSEVNDIIKNIKLLNNPGLSDWIARMAKAVQFVNQDTYEKLVNA